MILLIMISWTILQVEPPSLDDEVKKNGTAVHCSLLKKIP